MRSFDKILPLVTNEITGNSQDGRRRPYLSKDLRQIQAGASSFEKKNLSVVLEEMP